MDITIAWKKRVPLHSEGAGHYSINLEQLPAAGGVYVIARWHGQSFEALYVGRSANIRGRVKQHLDSVKQMDHLAQAGNGARVILAGVIAGKPGIAKRRQVIAERALIQYFASRGDDLVNKKGMSLRQHQIKSNQRPHGLPLRVYQSKA
jgi:hypothetical protein